MKRYLKLVCKTLFEIPTEVRFLKLQCKSTVESKTKFMKCSSGQSFFSSLGYLGGKGQLSEISATEKFLYILNNTLTKRKRLNFSDKSKLVFM